MTDLIIQKGLCYVLYAFEVGQSIDLDACDDLIPDTKERTKIRRNRKAPTYFEYQPPPVRVTHHSRPIVVGSHSTQATVESTLYDFGAVSVMYSIQLSDVSFSDLLPLSCELFNHEGLIFDANERVEHLLRTISPAVVKPYIAETYEDYRIFEIEKFNQSVDFESYLVANGQFFARVLEGEEDLMSDSSVSETLACRIAYGPSDLAVIDWNTAIIFGGEADDVKEVLEFANVELLEMRFLDGKLDKALDEAYHALTRNRFSQIAKLQRIARLQVDGAILYEGVNNALKLLGDQYLARVYSLVSRRFHLAEWDSSILRKLSVLDSIYGKISDYGAQRRMEVLEWIIILLIAVSIALPFVGK